MELNLLACTAQRPDKRGIANCLAEFATNGNTSLANEFMEMLLEGDIIDIVVDDGHSGSALRALRKLGIDYEIVE